MQGRSAEDVHGSVLDNAPAGPAPTGPPPIGPGRTSPGHAMTPDSPLRQTLLDMIESGRRVARQLHRPTRKGVAAFFGAQLAVDTAGWTAGLIAAALVSRFFEVKGLRNLWGLAAHGDRMIVSAADYELIVRGTSYSAGLMTLILMRKLVLRLFAEFHALRRERMAEQRGRARDGWPSQPSQPSQPVR
jgi:hypothetical protein